ncbi:DNA polymerase III subunit alpha (plasmid) [Aneurinibacillus sp. Ricciae_BoGa-3]|uniref:DNA polymerase III subunit alpha n=1 Tax=Aneurinibacillus sp. Ricciae_BoGa-3 TaxID=3022697 RepID=UPI00233F9113|nr:DNA polymerase III subunit alpha [Aneurinibacillus sp. Ricciae_BoGa-3]WCK56967.1 DNA polymerase III subunit alpha [Aneurinibacillus sp. Ricciae_BoGa-3]
MIEIKNGSEVVLEKGSFLDVMLEDTHQQPLLTFSSNGTKLDTVEAGEALNLFQRRQKLKAIVKEITETGMSVEIVRWADIHRKSGFSLLKASSHIKDIVEKTEHVGALTDEGVMFGAVTYYKKMKEADKKAIVGFEAFTESIDGAQEAHHLLLLAMNAQGFKNLTKLTTMGYEHVFESPQVSYEMLERYAEGVIATSSYLDGEIAKCLLNGDYESAKRVALKLSSIFGKENFYIEIQRHGVQDELTLNMQLIRLARELNLKIVGAVESHYTNKEDELAHQALLCLQTGTTMDDNDRLMLPGEGYHIHTAEEMEELFSDIPEALDTTLEIAEKCNLVIDLDTVYMPHFPVPAPYKDEAAYFEYLCWKGFDERFEGTEKQSSAEYRERLEFEIDTIKSMGFPGYFLIVWDFVDYAKRHGILVGPGRGSACGSLVAYALYITEVDPIEYDLLFERFLNPERISMPDIDLDFDDRRREEVIDYVKEKFGAHAVSRIITFGTLAARAVIRDMTRVLDKPYSLGDKIAKSIPQAPKMTLQKAFKESVEFSKIYEHDHEAKEIIDMAMKLEGLPRNISQHACGVIIAPSAVSDYIPQILIENEDTGLKEPTTQITMAECEELGLLKMDFLGLRTMGVVGRCLADVNKRRAKEGKEPINFLNIPTDDLQVYDFISKGNTEGVFQLESPGMTSFMKELFQDANKYLSLKSKEQLKEMGRQMFERLIAGISLYRPGPIDEIPHYIENMLNPQYITYETPQLENILKRTYGVIVYQEEVMFIVRELAGFTKGQADTIRKAMGKKKKEILNEYEAYFIHGSQKKGIVGCIANGIPEETAKSIWAKMKKFAEYAFNKSHAGGYAEISIRTGWLAFYYPVEYMTATLNSFITKADKIKLYLSVCKKKGIEVLSPDVNKSREVFTVDGDAIRFGLMGIKNMGKVSTDVIAERDARGTFKDFQDFAERMAKHFKVDKRMLEALVYSGAVDDFEGTRKAKLSVLPEILDSASIEKKNYQSGQLDLFSLSDDFAEFKHIAIPEVAEFDKKVEVGEGKRICWFLCNGASVGRLYGILRSRRRI